MKALTIMKLSLAPVLTGIALSAGLVIGVGLSLQPNTKSDTTIIPTMTPVAAATPILVPVDTSAPVSSPASVQTELDNHEGRIEALEAATPAPVSLQAVPVATIDPTPKPTPFPLPSCAPVTASESVCVGN